MTLILDPLTGRTFSLDEVLPPRSRSTSTDDGGKGLIFGRKILSPEACSRRERLKTQSKINTER
jgi:hypothetical protein